MSDELTRRARAVRAAQRTLGAAAGAHRSRALEALGRLLHDRRSALLSVNREDLDEAASAALDAPLRHRLALTDAKLDGLRDGTAKLAAKRDPIGRVLRRTELDDGLTLSQVTSPLGVLLIVFESRPDAVIQIGSLAIRSGNGVILKGGREARRSNAALVGCLRDALDAAGLPRDAVASVEGRDEVAALLELDDCIDLVIPRGSSELVRSIRDATRIPVLGHAEGICHLYLDASADLQMATRLAIDGKCDYPAACNATETLLVHRELLPRLAPLAHALTEHGVELRADAAALAALPGARPATESDWSAEYGELILAVRTVDDIGAAIDHVHEFGSAHTDAIVADDEEACARFLREVDSASVFANASTRFADGYRYGLGAEVGISTSKIHARGPVGVEGLLTTRWLLEGHGQVAADYGPGKRPFTHTSIPVDD